MRPIVDMFVAQHEQDVDEKNEVTQITVQPTTKEESFWRSEAEYDLK